jgi:hypothetical protein
MLFTVRWKHIAKLIAMVVATYRDKSDVILARGPLFESSVRKVDRRSLFLGVVYSSCCPKFARPTPRPHKQGVFRLLNSKTC